MKVNIASFEELKRGLSDGDIVYLETANKPEIDGWWIVFNGLLFNINDKIKMADEPETKTTPQNTYIDACHFGNKQPYTWRVPEHLKDRVEKGKIARVKTKHGDQLVEIMKVYKKEVKPSVHRGVVDVLDD